MENCPKIDLELEDVLNEKQLEHILSQTAKPGAKIVSYDLKSAITGKAGFLADHFRLTLYVKEDSVKKIHLFLKTLPMNNLPKCEMIKENNFNTREALVYKLFDEMDDSYDPNPWRPKAYIYSDSMLVMPDLSVEGYRSFPASKYLDKNHVMVTTKSIARFHAAFANYETKKILNSYKPYSFLEEYGHLMKETIFLDAQWAWVTGKLIKDVLEEFSPNFPKYPADLTEQLADLFNKAAKDLKEYENTLNVIVHKDLWFNNILFRYNGDVADNAVLLDYQCILLAPPAFDMMQHLYLTTTKSFRERHENDVLRHYYSVFSKSLDDDTKQRLAALNYDLEHFLGWCEKARLNATMLTAFLFPYILMDPVQAQKIFDDPETFEDLLMVDRSPPVIANARENNMYRTKLLDISELIVEKYILGSELA